MNSALTPKAIVAALDEHIVGQDDAKKAVAVALRNRWRRQQLSPELREEVTPKNILMIGPTGCGKTEISRRLAKLADAPFVKVEATKFTEVGYVGRDVEQIARDLVEEAVRLERERRRNTVKAAAEDAAMDKLLDALTGKGSSEATRASFRQRFKDGSLATAEVEIEVQEAPSMPFEVPGMGGQVGFDFSEMMGKAFGRQAGKRRKLKVPDAFARLTEEEADKRIDPDDINRIALADAEANGIVFLDEIDKIAVSDVRGGSVVARRRAARPAAADRGHHRRHQIRAAEDRPHAVHRLGRVPHGQARRPVARAPGAAADPGRTESADPAGFRAHPVGDAGQPDRAVSGAAGDRECTDRVHRRRHRGAGADRRRGERGGREYRRPAAPDGDGEIARGRQLHAEDRGGETLTVDAAFVDQQLSSIARNADLSRYVL